jgi:hypothetical protein
MGLTSLWFAASKMEPLAPLIDDLEVDVMVAVHEI